MRFSQRQGITPVKSVIQVESMDDDLRNGLWNALTENYWDAVYRSWGSSNISNRWRDKNLNTGFVREIQTDFFKLPYDQLDTDWPQVLKVFRLRFYSFVWYEVYDFIEFIANVRSWPAPRDFFIKECNRLFEREVSVYRFLGGFITQITSETEIEGVEEALVNSQPLKPVHDHLNRALELLADRQAPDYRNSIKESISAVEAISKLITGQKSADLAGALNKVQIGHSALKQGFTKLYGWSSDASGVRHALKDEPSVDFEDAKYMLVSCSAFVSYLIVKAQKAGLQL